MFFLGYRGEASKKSMGAMSIDDEALRRRSTVQIELLIERRGKCTEHRLRRRSRFGALL